MVAAVRYGAGAAITVLDPSALTGAVIGDTTAIGDTIVTGDTVAIGLGGGPVKRGGAGRALGGASETVTL